MFSHFLARRPDHVVPTGLIIPCSSASAPSGWSTFSAASTYFIIGAGSTYTIGSSSAGSGSFVATTNTAGLHYGSTVIEYVNNSGNKYRLYASAGNHAHTFTVAFSPPHQNVHLIKASAGNTTIPGYGSVFTYGVSKSAVASNIYITGNMLRGSISASTGGSLTYSSQTSNVAGAHGHGSQDSGDSSGYRCAETDGEHSHTETISFTNTLYTRALATWYAGASDIPLKYFGSQIIGMYESLTPPAGWYLCNGNNGTPDMRDRFAKLVAVGSSGSGSGDGTVTATTSGTITHGTHEHGNNNETAATDKSAWHDDYLAMPAHNALNDNQTWLPPYYPLAFIMKG